MKNAFNKDVFREIKNTVERFLGIFSIIVLGVSFYTGIGSTGHQMKNVMDTYLDEQNMMDIRVVSNYGLNKNDIKAISQVEGVQQVYPTYNMDALVHNKDRTLLMKVHALDISGDLENPMNKPFLLSGRLPQKGNEAVVEKAMLVKLGVEIGDTVTLESGKKADIRNRLKTKTYKIVGTVKSPYYISTERGTGTIGNGKVDCYMMIPQENFTQDVYSEGFIKVKGTDRLFCFSDAYEDSVSKVVKRLEELETVRVKKRAAEMTQKAYERVNTQQKQVADRQQETNVQFDETQVQLNSAFTQIDQSNESLRSGQNQLHIHIEELGKTKEKLHTGLYEIEVGLNTIQDRLREREESQILLEEARQVLNEKEAEIIENEAFIKSMYPSDSPTLAAALAEIEEGKREIFESKVNIDASQKQLDESLLVMEASMAELEMNRTTVTESLSEVVSTKEVLEMNLRNMTQNNKQIAESKTKLEKNKSEFEETKRQVTAELDEAKHKLQQARKELNDIDEPNWYVLDRESNAGFLGYREDADKIQSIGQVFPLFFFLVAALVCLTTMSRLVEERRTEIGTLKALGYGSIKILSKYVIYAVVPTLLGGIAGGYIGMRVYPTVIMRAYSNLYTMPQRGVLLDFPLWGLGILLGVLTTTMAAIQTCSVELKENPSTLLRAKSPKLGKKMLIESFTIFWKRLSFTQKVTIRNIVRYKKRFFMTIIGIGGCTALILTGFGLKNSISGLITKQFGMIFMYDLKTSFTDSAQKKDITTVNNYLTMNSISRESTTVREKMLDVESGNGRTEKATIIVPEDTEVFHSFITLQERVSKNPLFINEEGVILNEKLAKLLEVSVGDELTVKDGDETAVVVKVTGICENYFNNYIYMHKNYYEKLFDEEAAYNTIYTVLDKTAASNESNALAKEILDKKNVGSVSFTKSITGQFGGTIDSLNIVIIVLVVSAGALAFIVLYNLTSININERIRELATIEVLGFRDSEVAAYVYRENILLTAVGILLGFVLGYFFHLYLINTVESKLMMFSRNIWATSYLYAMVITAMFSMGVNKLTSGRLKKINMVEALKSIE